jgi:two-component system, sensor histidine kinase and response regulator
VPLRVAPGEQAVADLPAAAAHCRLLVVDDQPDTRAAMLGQLHTLGVGRHAQLAGAGSAAQAEDVMQQARARGEPFDLVLLDWVLPDGEGNDVIDRLRALQPGVQVVVMSAYGADDMREQASLAGAARFLDKPVLPDDLRRLFAAPADGAALPHTPGMRVDSQLGSLQGLRVLMAEDNAINQELAVELLSSRGAMVDVVHNGLQAVERLAAAGPEAFDVVLMDLQMPVLDGLQATQRLRAQKRFDPLPIVAFTAHALAEEQTRSMAAGMQGYLTKPLNMKELVRVLQPYRGRTVQSAAQLSAQATAPPTSSRVTTRDGLTVPTIAGIDLALALTHFDDSGALLQRTLGGFARAYGAGLGVWHGWLRSQAWTELHRAAHTLQGLAGTIGASALRAQALNLERHAKAQDSGAAQAALTQLERRLSEQVSAIDEALNPAPATDFHSTVLGEVALAPAQAVAGLRELLESSDSDAVGWWKTHRAALQQVLLPPQRRAIGMAIARFDFDVALAALDGRNHVIVDTRPISLESQS